MIIRLFAVLGIAALAYILFAAVGFDLSLLQALVCGIFFVALDWATTKMHDRYLDKIGA